MTQRRFLKCTLGFVVCLPVFAASSELAVDRGLPQINLNNSSGTVRSNVRWGWYDQGFVGDTFTLGSPGERWVIDSIRTWTVPGDSNGQPAQLGDYYQDVRLYFGKSNDVTPFAAAALTPGSNETGNPNIRITEASQNGAPPYDDFGTSLRVWQVEFNHLNLMVEGGGTYRFGVWGAGRQIAGSDKSYAWFNHASNAGLSGAPQEAASGSMLLFDAGGRFQGNFNSQGSGWDKPADINVQVIAHPVREHTTGTALQ